MSTSPQKSDKSLYYSLAVINSGVGIMLASLLVAVSMPRPVELSNSPILASIAVPTTPMPPVKKEPIVGTPVRVVVPSVGIDLAVQPGAYNPEYGTWVIGNDSAYHADVTVPVNNANGTTLIYGHAQWGVFGRLPEVDEGAEALIYTAEGTVFRYIFQSSRQVDPTDVSELTVVGSPRLLLQTCSGPFDAYRTLVAFRLEGITNNG
jgi:LPXTG-site transpeptidase (sortase) family protein